MSVISAILPYLLQSSVFNFIHPSIHPSIHHCFQFSVLWHRQGANRKKRKRGMERGKQIRLPRCNFGRQISRSLHWTVWTVLTALTAGLHCHCSTSLHCSHCTCFFFHLCLLLHYQSSSRISEFIHPSESMVHQYVQDSVIRFRFRSGIWIRICILELKSLNN